MYRLLPRPHRELAYVRVHRLAAGDKLDAQDYYAIIDGDLFDALVVGEAIIEPEDLPVDGVPPRPARKSPVDLPLRGQPFLVQATAEPKVSLTQTVVGLTVSFSGEGAGLYCGYLDWSRDQAGLDETLCAEELVFLAQQGCELLDERNRRLAQRLPEVEYAYIMVYEIQPDSTPDGYDVGVTATGRLELDGPQGPRLIPMGDPDFPDDE